MRRMRLLAAGAAYLFATMLSAAAHENCGCRERLVLNGRLNTADFDGGVGDRFGDGGAGYGGGYAFSYGGASAGAFAGGSAFAAAPPPASARGPVSAHFRPLR